MSADPEPTTPETHRKPPFLRRVRIRNFKSIKFCDVTLEPLTVLVGRNGSGKSNFFDALTFLRDVVTWGIDKAVTLHGGSAVAYRLAPVPLTIEVDYNGSRWDDREKVFLPTILRYSFAVTHLNGRPRLSSERLRYLAPDGERWVEFDSPNVTPAEPKGTLSLLQTRYECGQLRFLSDYHFDVAEIRRPQPPDAEEWLVRSGSNLAAVLGRIQLLEDDSGTHRRVGRYLTSMVQEVRSVESVRVADYDAIRFSLNGGLHPFGLFAASMSDGTLRILATLVAAFQFDSFFGSPSLIAIEEPETSLHPGAMRALVDALDEATGRTQILLTTHSTELLDNPTIRPENVRVVEMVNGETVITPVDEASVEIVKRQLDTLGGLERQNQLSLNDADRERQQQLAAGAEPK